MLIYFHICSLNRAEMKMTKEELLEELKSKKRIVVTAHNKPDGDAMGSTLAIYRWLKHRDHDVVAIMPSDYPEFLHFLPDNDAVRVFTDDIPGNVKLIEAADMVFVLDLNDLGRTAKMAPYLEEAKAKKIMIDHHLDPKDFADFAISDTSASSTCEMVYQLLKSIDAEKEIDAELATCLMTGLITDTGRFAHSHSPTVYETAAGLIALGADAATINDQVFSSFSMDRLKFLGFSLNDRLEYVPEHKTAIMALSSSDFKKFNFKTGDTEGLVNMPLTVNDVQISALITQHENIVKLSLRSKGSFPVNKIVADHFQGGGHLNAAGGRSMASLKATVEKFKKVLPNYMMHLA